MLVFTLAIMFLAYYSTGVVGRWETREMISERLEQLSNSLDENIKRSTEITQEIYENYKSKSRITAIMLSKNTGIMQSDVSFEEMRVIIGASSISVSDDSGVIEYSTSLSGKKEMVNKEFLPAVDNKVFSEAMLYHNNGKTTVLTGSSRLDADGVIQIEYDPQDAEMILKLNDLSRFITDIPLMVNGHFALIDSETYKYISHTDSIMNGTGVQFPADEFEEEKGWFRSEFEGEDVLVQYLKHDGYILVGTLPFSEIYSHRNSVVVWLAFALSTSAFITILTVRNKILIYNSHQEKNNL